MAGSPPLGLLRLLETRDEGERESAWSQLVAGHSRLLLHVARSFGGDRDAAMDRYAYMLGELRSDDFRRLRRYVADGTSEFSTWLVVVAQRMCLDYHRKRYGRPRGACDLRAREEEWAARRRLVDLLSAQVDVSELSGPAGPGPEEDIRISDLYGALDAALRCLEPSDRLLVKLRFEDDLSVPEIARTLRLPTRFHVYRLLTQVLTRLRAALEQKGVHDAIP